MDIHRDPCHYTGACNQTLHGSTLFGALGVHELPCISKECVAVSINICPWQDPMQFGIKVLGTPCSTVKHFPQHMKLHHCSYISMSFLQHILLDMKVHEISSSKWLDYTGPLIKCCILTVGKFMVVHELPSMLFSGNKSSWIISSRKLDDIPLVVANFPPSECKEEV